MTTPVILLAFANDQDDHLDMLTRERKAISTALQRHEDSRYIRLHVEPNAAIEDVFALFNRFAGQIAIFHYGGHASGAALNLETASGDNEVAHAGGLAKLIGMAESLQLVFLNGCATRGQVETLLANGVKAVIATAVPIDDTMATEFAEEFYRALASGKTIKQSFDSATALIASRYDNKQPIGEFRGMSWGDKTDAVAAGVTWGLYLQPEGDTAIAWKLPEQAETEVIVRGAAFSASADKPINDGLIQSQFNAIASHSPELEVMLEFAKKTGRLDLRMIRQQIVDSYPSPVGEQLRKLFASNSIDEHRLRQLVLTYETVIKLFCYTALSQLWNALHDKPKLTIADQDWESIEAFKQLDEAGTNRFDYLGLIIAIARILETNGVAPFMAECVTLQQELTDTETGLAHKFMDEMRAELAGGGVEAGEIESFCVQAETHLGTILADLAFIVRYKMATIKRILIKKTRHKQATFFHRQVLLDRLTADFMDSDEIRITFTDNESVILLKSLDDVSDYLNLTPFLVDENALLGHEKSKIYFYSHYDPASDAYHYYSIADPTDRRIVSDALAHDREAWLPMKGLMEEFRELVSRR